MARLVEVDGDKKIAGTDGCRTRAGGSIVPRAVAEVRPVFTTETLGQTFIFAAAADCEILAPGFESRSLVGVNGYIQFVGDTTSEVAGHFGGLFEGNAADRNQRADVSSAHARVCAMMAAHVDKLSSFPDATECSFLNRFGIAYESYYSPVGGFAGVYIKKTHAFYRFNRIGNLFDNSAIAPF